MPTQYHIDRAQVGVRFRPGSGRPIAVWLSVIATVHKNGAGPVTEIRK